MYIISQSSDKNVHFVKPMYVCIDLGMQIVPGISKLRVNMIRSFSTSRSSVLNNMTFWQYTKDVSNKVYIKIFKNISLNEDVFLQRILICLRMTLICLITLCKKNRFIFYKRDLLTQAEQQYYPFTFTYLPFFIINWFQASEPIQVHVIR